MTVTATPCELVETEVDRTEDSALVELGGGVGEGWLLVVDVLVDDPVL